MEHHSPQKHYVNNLFNDCFSEVTDPRRNTKGNLQHEIQDMIFLVVSAVVSGADDWFHIQMFGESQIDWLRKFAPFKNGIPSHDTLGRVFAAIDFNQLSTCFIDWTNSINQLNTGEVIAIDGKRLRGSHDRYNNKAAIHMVSAFACDNGISLGQVTTNAKSNEITAIPELLNLLSIKGCTVTIDAMGCQKHIVKNILKNEANYILAVKENQPELLAQTKKLFSLTNIAAQDETIDAGHGRVEKRKCSIITDLTFFDEIEQWPELSSLVRIESERYIKLTNKTAKETRYYISNCPADAKKMNKDIRSHWQVENNLHWMLDVNFNEDLQRKRKGDSASNFNILIKIAMAFLKKAETKKKTSMRAKRYRATLSTNFREHVLNL